VLQPTRLPLQKEWTFYRRIEELPQRPFHSVLIKCVRRWIGFSEDDETGRRRRKYSVAQPHLVNALETTRSTWRFLSPPTPMGVVRESDEAAVRG
jgi:hypothetical protein